MRRPFVPIDVALLRAVSPGWAGALRAVDDGPLDFAAAARQHADYARALVQAGVAVTVLPADPRQPDCCFIEDTAVVVGHHALATRPGAAARRGEVWPVVDALVSVGCIVHRMGPPATLEGGDVLRVGDVLYVGLSQRTNRAGVEALAAVAALEGLAVKPVELGDAMHLKGVVTLADADTAVVDADAIDPARVAAWGLSVIEAAEPVGANVLALGRGQVLVPAEAPATAERLRRRGFGVRTVEGAALHRADGRLTCLSLRLPRPGGWCG